MKENWLVIMKCNEVRYAIPSSKKNVAHLQRMFHMRKQGGFFYVWVGDRDCHTVTSVRVTLLCLAWVPFIEDLLEALTSGLVASSHDSEEHA